MDAVDEIRIHQEIAANAFFQDVLLFLQEAGRDPFRLTDTGNLRLAEIHYLGEHFHQDIYHRHLDGERWSVRSEAEVPPLKRIRLLVEHMRLTAISRRRLGLSLSGKDLLARPPQEQFETLTLWYLQRYDWGEWYTYRAKLARTLQQAQHFLWRYFLYRQDTRIAFSQFLAGLRGYFGLDALINDPSSSFDDVLWAVQGIVIQDLRLFGLLSVESHTYGNFRTDEAIYSFQPTALGVHIFELALRAPAAEISL